VEDVVIVGAGPAGLAAAAALRARGTDAIILERGQHVGEQWRSRYDRLHLHTIRWLSDLPGYRIPREFGRWVARDQFVRYLEQYAAHHGLEPQFGVEATRIDRDDGHWAIRTSGGTIPARIVVMASGYTRVPYLPRWPGTFDGPMVHSAEYRNPGPYRGQDVLIIGAGNSGTEIAVDLADGGAGRVRVAVRTPPNILRRDTKGFPTQLVGIAFQRLPPRLLDPLILALRQATIPDLTCYGLPPPGAPFSQFRRTATVPILTSASSMPYAAERSRSSLQSPHLTVGLWLWPMGPACIPTPLWQRLVTTPAWSRSSAISRRSENTGSQARSHTSISSESVYRSPGCCIRWERILDRRPPEWLTNSGNTSNRSGHGP
jgi:NADPH-dependent 2,4-dienoyl-CoA reductase/sulfur reductase-like enzyme